MKEFNIRKEIQSTRFNNCISLGFFCGTASSMEKMGLRSHSGPFDWYISDFDSVLKCIESDFASFMKPENLKLSENNAKVFIDSEYGFYCNHDIKYDFNNEIEMICEKYHRRANYFLEATKKPTCFFRAVRSESEITYICENAEYISRIIKKNNSQNEICFVILNEMKDLPDVFTWFRLSFKKYISESLLAIRNLFAGNTALQKICPTLLEKEILDKNIIFDKLNNYTIIQSALSAYSIKNNETKVAKQIINYLHISTNDILYVWGAGARGIPLTDYLLMSKIHVSAIIDNDVSKQDLNKETPIITFNKINKDCKIFISISDKDMIKDIIRQIKAAKLNIQYMTYDNLVLDESSVDKDELFAIK